MADLKFELKTTTQVYYNEYLNTWMTRIWYIDHVKGRDVQRMREEETCKESIPSSRESLLYKPEESEAAFQEALKKAGFNDKLGV